MDPQIEFNALVKQLERILEAEAKTKPFDDETLNKKSLTKYKAILEVTKVEEHLALLNHIYSTNRIQILASVKKDDWLKSGSVVMHYAPTEALKKKSIKLMVSAIYNIALKLQDTAETKMVSMSDDERERFESSCHELIYPDTVLLHLYRIFSLIAPEGDKNRLKAHIKTIEQFLQITVEEPAAAIPSIIPSGPQLDGIIGSVTSIVQNSGMVPPGTKLPTGDDLKKILGGILDNDQIKKGLTGVASTLQSSSDPNAAIQKIVTDIAKPEFIGVLSGTMQQTMAQAQAAAVAAHEARVAAGEVGVEKPVEAICDGDVCVIPKE